MKKDKKQMSIHKVWRLNIRSMLLWWNNSPDLFASYTLHAMVDALFPLIGIYFSAKIINELAGSRRPDQLAHWVLLTLFIGVGAQLLRAVLLRWSNGCYAGTYYKSQRFYAEKMLSIDFCDVDNSKTLDLLSQIRQNDNWSGWGINRTITHYQKLLTAVTRIIGSITLSVTLFSSKVVNTSGKLIVLNNPLFIVLILAVLFLLTWVSPVLSNKANTYWAKAADKARMGNRVFGFYGFMGYNRDRALDIRMYEQEEFCSSKMKDDNSFTPKGLIAAYARGPMGILHALSASISRILTAVVYSFVCLKAWAGAFGIGSVTQYIGAITQLSDGLSDFIGTLGDMRNNASFLEKTFEYLDIQNDMYQGSLTIEKRQDNNYTVEFKDVSFKYPNTETWALRHVSMKFHVGERLAIVGQNGSGKSTFIKLLCRLYDPDEGEILLNGINIRKYNYREYMQIFSVVFQDFKLLAFKLGENVGTSKTYDYSLVINSLKKAGFEHRLEELRDGLDTYLYKDFSDEGVEISGGEAQKIAIARALYRDEPFLILDEPTAALDPIAEFEVYSKLNDIVEDKTTVFISHRLSSCRFSDRIVVFDQGQIVQVGSHNDLLVDSDGMYYTLWNAQAKYYQTDEERALLSS
ncbi:ABC transporter ATP-binding protein [Proteiniborus sp. MB09-C3]|uniref:ABC transporter ATP-binding protein n=1 Tax=Proteiniborus sp. MB09-C3 TaxID=3050072 RepID=UPI00255756BD|nr:ABC transporter ATP-binding protein [Proteiniborus sp. MB09-C3]WIV11947.1 ABC transporter ATP-binding protein [Proteiniborus sp. MB09-C3]